MQWLISVLFLGTFGKLVYSLLVWTFLSSKNWKFGSQFCRLCSFSLCAKSESLKLNTLDEVQLILSIDKNQENWACVARASHAVQPLYNHPAGGWLLIESRSLNSSNISSNIIAEKWKLKQASRLGGWSLSSLELLENVHWMTLKNFEQPVNFIFYR